MPLTVLGTGGRTVSQHNLTLALMRLTVYWEVEPIKKNTSQVLHGTGCHGNTEAEPDPVAGRHIKEVFLEEVPPELGSEGQVRVRQSRNSIPGQMSRTWQGLVNGKERASESGIQKPASTSIPYSRHFSQVVTLPEV